MQHRQEGKGNHYRDNEFIKPLDNALKFYLLRQLSFSGMLRFSKDGKYNIPFGITEIFYENTKFVLVDDMCTTNNYDDAGIM